jgi:hypothetical protein
VGVIICQMSVHWPMYIRCILNGCRNVSDISALGQYVYMLDLSWCRNVSDVSALGHVHTLDLRGCGNVLDVSALSHVHKLYI